jgi:hypothetical protein
VTASGAPLNWVTVICGCTVIATEAAVVVWLGVVAFAVSEAVMLKLGVPETTDKVAHWYVEPASGHTQVPGALTIVALAE